LDDGNVKLLVFRRAEDSTEWKIGLGKQTRFIYRSDEKSKGPSFFFGCGPHGRVTEPREVTLCRLSGNFEELARILKRTEIRRQESFNFILYRGQGLIARENIAGLGRDTPACCQPPKV